MFASVRATLEQWPDHQKVRPLTLAVRADDAVDKTVVGSDADQRTSWTQQVAHQ